MNHRNYPFFTEVLRQLEVPLADSSMTFSYHDCKSGYAYSGDRIATLFPTPSHYTNFGHCRMVLISGVLRKLDTATYSLGSYRAKRLVNIVRSNLSV